MRKHDGEPIIAVGGLWRLAAIILILWAGHLAARLLDFRPKHAMLAPPEIREHAAECVLTNDVNSCAIARRWRPHE